MQANDEFVPWYLLLLVFMLPLSFTTKLTNKTTSNSIIFFYHHHLEFLASECMCILLASPHCCTQWGTRARPPCNKEAFIIFFTLSSSLGVFQTSPLLLVRSSLCNVLNQLLVCSFIIRRVATSLENWRAYWLRNKFARSAQC